MNKKLILVALLVGATTAHAQPAPAPPAGGDSAQRDDAKAKAKALYDKGLGHYNLGEFDAAIAAFKEAYALSSAPGLLFNIAQSFRLKKDYEQATYFYTTYLRLKPDAPNRDDVQARLSEMEKLIAEQKAQELKPPVGTVNPEGDTAQKQPEHAAAVAPQQAPTTAPVPPEGGGRAQRLMTAGIVTGGTGVALLITGVIFGRMASSAEDELDQLGADMGTWSQAHQDKYDTGQRNNRIAIVSFVVGGVALATGGTLYALGMTKKTKASVAITPMPGGAAAGVGWTF